MRVLVLLFSVLAVVVPGRRASASPPQPPPPSPAPADPLPRRSLALPDASPGYRDGLRPVPEPARVRPYLLAAEHRRAEQVWEGLREELFEIARTVAQQPAPDPVSAPGPVPQPVPGPRLPRRRPSEHAPSEPDLTRSAPAAPAASAGPPSPETLRRVLVRLRELDAQATAETNAYAPAALEAGLRSGGGY